VALASAMALGGCISLSPSQVSAMSAYEICEMQVNQGPNISEASRGLLASELGRRKETCAPHFAGIQRQRDQQLWDDTYNNFSP
jgi:hypothetical protein